MCSREDLPAVDDEAVEDVGRLVAEHLVDLADVLAGCVDHGPAAFDEKPRDRVTRH